MKKYHTVAFDLDGTLTDPSQGLISAFIYAFKKLSMKPESREELRRLVGPALREQFMAEYGMTLEESERALSIFREYYSVYGWWDNSMYEGIPELLSQLRGMGKRIILATSKPEIFAVKILKLFGIYEYFDFVGGASFDKSRENKAQVLEYAILESGAKQQGLDGVILVGDTKYDVEGANAVGIDSLGVLYGFGKREELVAEGATYIAQTVADIIKYL